MTIRLRVQRWLGLNEIGPALVGLAESEKEQSSRYGELLERMERLERHFAVQHVSRPKNLPVYDWEQVQLQELALMLASPPKEEN